MSNRLLEDIKRQQQLMNLDEQLLAPLQSFLDLSKRWSGQDATSVDIDIPQLNNLKGSFEDMTTQVIDKLEGGYYHPDMVKDGRHPGGMGNSGETMMGIDRKHGGTINTSAEGKEFWNLIDKADAKKKWKWNYRGGGLESKLKDLVVRMMKPNYEAFVSRYLTPEAAKIVNGNPSLMFNFIYAVWNGPGWFQKFAKVVNDAVKQGIKNPDELTKKVIQARLNSGNKFIAQGGKKIDDFIGTNLA